MTRSRPRSIAALAALLALSGLAACSADPHQGYSFAGTYSENIRTVAVPIFDNRTYSTGVEIQLTEAIVKEIQRTTHWTVTTGPAADATLTGIVTSSELRRLSVDPQTGLDQEVGVELRCDYELRDNRSGKVLSARKGFTAMDTFVASRRVGERPEIGQTATISAMARDLVAELRDPW